MGTTQEPAPGRAKMDQGTKLYGAQLTALPQFAKIKARTGSLACYFAPAEHALAYARLNY